MIAIAAVDRNWAIGRKGELLARIGEDLRRFRALTEGRTLIYGRKTLATFPRGEALPGRRNLMLTRRPAALLWPEAGRGDGSVREGARRPECVGGVEALLAALSPEERRTAAVIGGAEVYRQLLPHVEAVWLTLLDTEFPAADAHFPRLDRLPEWRLAERGAWRSDEGSGLRFCYLRYERQAEDGR